MYYVTDPKLSISGLSMHGYTLVQACLSCSCNFVRDMPFAVGYAEKTLQSLYCHKAACQ